MSFFEDPRFQLIELNNEIAKLENRRTERDDATRAAPLPPRGPSSFAVWIISVERQNLTDEINQLRNRRDSLIEIVGAEQLAIPFTPDIIGSNLEQFIPTVQTVQPLTTPTENNTLRNALLVGGALLLIL